jgi:hypothetical protein
VRTKIVSPVPQSVAPTVKLFSTDVEVVPEIGRGSSDEVESHRVRLNISDATSQLFSIVVLRMKRGAATLIGILISRQVPVLGEGKAPQTVARMAKRERWAVCMVATEEAEGQDEV